MPFVILPTNSASGGYDITNSLRFNSGSSDYLSRTPASAGNRRTFTISTWFKRADIGRYQYLYGSTTDSWQVNWFLLYIDTGNTLNVLDYNSGSNFSYDTTQTFRDPSAWYHIVVAIDTTQATSTNRVKLYVNGSQVTAFDVATAPTQNLDTRWNNNIGHYIGQGDAGSYYYSGYMSDFYSIDGQQLEPSSFGETDFDTGIWKPKAYTGTYGTNGFYLQFKNSASLGTDSSGNGNTFTVNNLTSIDQTTDTPTNNFATMNSVDRNTGGTVAVFTEGNLTVAHLSGANGSHTIARSTLSVNKGKWYSEYKIIAIGGGTDRVGVINIAQLNYVTDSNPFLGTFSAGYAYMSSGNKENNGTSSAYGASYTTNDIIGIALDCDNGTVIFYKNGASQGTAFTGLDTSLYYAFSSSPYSDQTGSHNFGSPAYSANSYTDGAGYGNFSYAVPSGYFALCTKNLATFG
jgi:hypothetical protein